MKQRDKQMELVKHIEAINAKTQRWMDENPGSWGGMIVTDPAHWAEYGVHTVADYERYELETYIYEGHKDAFGTKGRHYDFKNMTMEELKAEADYISNAVKNTMEEEAQAEKQRVEQFEAQVKHTIAAGAGNRKTAIRWIIDGEGLTDEKDMSYICYSLGLPYSMEDELQSALN